MTLKNDDLVKYQNCNEVTTIQMLHKQTDSSVSAQFFN
jgi:hypothetical protein